MDNQNRKESHHQWLSLTVLLSGTLLPPLDFFIVNTALPSIQQSLSASGSVCQLVVSCYAASYAVFLIAGGRLGDIYGRKKVFITGMVCFALSSALCGMAKTPQVLIFGRLLQGIAGAIMAPQSLALIHAIFPDGMKKRAVGFYSATFGLASVLGLLLGGVLLTANFFDLGWRLIFLINLPVVAIAVPATCVLLHETRNNPSRLDSVGIVLLAAALMCLVFPLIEGREERWPLWSLCLLVVSFPGLVIFWNYEIRVVVRGGIPLIDPTLFSLPGLVKGVCAIIFFYSIAPFFLMFALYQQQGLGLPPLKVGMAILPLGVGFLLGPLCNNRFRSWMPHFTACTGIAMEILGMMVIALLVSYEQTQWFSVPLFIIGFGQGIAMPSLISRVVDGVDARWSGLVAGISNSALQLGGALAVAVIGGVFFTLLGQSPSAKTIAHAFSVSCLLTGAGLAVAGCLSVIDI